MWIIAIGSLDDGFRFTGTWPSEDLAQEWIDKQDSRLSMIAWPVKMESIGFAERVLAKVKAEENQ